MQKFKVSKEEFRKALKDISDWRFVSIELEGELLEGGTVEKCIHEKAITELCKKYRPGMAFLVSNGDSKKYWDLKDECEKVCHNKKKVYD